jgi:hypothetical protein
VRYATRGPRYVCTPAPVVDEKERLEKCITAPTTNNFSGFAVFAKKSNQYFICRKMLSRPFSSNPILRLRKDF